MPLLSAISLSLQMQLSGEVAEVLEGMLDGLAGDVGEALGAMQVGGLGHLPGEEKEAGASASQQRLAEEVFWLPNRI
jgi:hypothetical protein